MSSMIESTAVFRQRSIQIGLTANQVDLIEAAGYGTLARFAFCCNYAPHNADETPLVDALNGMLGGIQSAATLGLARRIFFEAYTLSSQDLRQRIERVDDNAPPRKMAAPERAFRYEAQVARLPGLSLVNELEPSDSLVDAAAQMYDDNRLSYLEWASCTKKSQEIGGVKKIPCLTFDSAGHLKLQQTSAGASADLETDLLVRYALQRRGLALDQANVLEYRLHDLWVDNLVDSKMRSPPTGWAKITWDMILAADRALFLKMSELTRTGIVLNAAGARPLDSAIMIAMIHPSVTFLLMPLPLSSPSSSASDQIPVQKPTKQGKKAKGAGEKGKNKGKGKGPKEPFPAALKGMWTRDSNGKPICFDFNLEKKCQRTVDSATNSCEKGVHICCRPRCGGLHPLYSCTGTGKGKGR